MNSSGIKRGLATTAVTALAIAGLPLIASAPANAVPGDTLTTVFAGPALNGGDLGALVVLESGVNDVQAAAGAIPAGTLRVAAVGNAAEGSQNNDVQNVEILSATLVEDGPTNAYGANDGQDEIYVRVKVTTAPVGATAAFRIYHEESAGPPAAGNGSIDAGEERTSVSVSTAGPVARVTVAPATQTVPAGVRSGDYALTLKDAQGRTTQLASTDDLLVSTDAATDVYDADDALVTEAAPTAPNEGVLTAEQLISGETTVTAESNTTAPHTINFSSVAVPTAAGRAILDVTAAANIDDDEVDVVTGADSYDIKDPARNLSAISVAPTEDEIVFNFKSLDKVAGAPNPDDAGTTVTLTFDGAGVTFGGEDKITKTVVLNSRGEGSITLNVDPGTIQNTDSIAVTGTFSSTLTFAPGAPDDIVPAAAAYIAAPKSSTTVTVTVLDDYGNPVTSGEVGAEIRDLSPNANATSTGNDQRKAVGPDGTVSFTFTDTKAVAGQADVIDFEYFTSNFDNSAEAGVVGSTEIRYTADGQGSDFFTSLDGTIASGAAYNPANNRAVALTDAVADGDTNNDAVVNAADQNESIDLDVTLAEANTAITVSVDNGALILEPGETDLAEGSASITDTVGAAGTLPAGYRIVGTKTGLVTATVVNAGRTETSQFTVIQEANEESTARNVTVTGPESAASGSTATFLAVVTDAFGNPVQGFERLDLNVTVSGPASFQDGSAESNENGEIQLNVRLFENADSPVTVSVSARESQFGADADRLTRNSTTDDAPGLTESVNSATASVANVNNLQELEEAVEEAEAALAVAEADLAAAQADLDVAQTQLAIAQGEVDRLQERKQNLRQKLNKAKANDNKKKAKTTRKKLRNVKSQLRDARQAAEVAQTAVEGEQTVVAEAQQAVTEAEEALAQAEQDLEDAQG